MQSRGHIQRDATHPETPPASASPFHCRPHCFRVNDAAPEYPGAVWERKETPAWSERTPVATSPRVAISGSIPLCSYLSSPRVPKSKHSDLYRRLLSEEFILLHRETSGREASGCQGSAEESQASALVQGRDGNLPGGGFTIQIRVNSHIHSFQTETLIYTV